MNASFKYKRKSNQDMAVVDPVCGIELDEKLALEHDYKGKKYYFCCHGCKRIFVKKPNKWKKD